MFKVIFWLLKKRARFKLVFPISVHLLWTRFLGILNSIVMHGHCDYLMPKLMHGHDLVCNLDQNGREDAHKKYIDFFLIV